MYDWVLNATLLSVIFKFEIVMKKCVKLLRDFFQPVAFPILPHNYVDYHTEHCAEVILSNAQKMKFSIKYSFSKCDQTRSFLRIWLHLLKKSLMENSIFCAVGNEARYNRIFLKVNFSPAIIT